MLKRHKEEYSIFPMIYIYHNIYVYNHITIMYIYKGTFHAKMGSIKDRNGMNLTEAKDIKKRWQEYTEELYKKRSS